MMKRFHFMRQVRAGYAFALIAAVCAGSLTPRAALALPVEVAEGYELEQVCPGFVPGFGYNPSSMALSRDRRKLYVSYISFFQPGQIRVLDLRTCDGEVLVPNIDTPMGLAMHPQTGQLYVSHRYLVDSNVPPIIQNTRSRISIVGPGGGLETFANNLPAMIFGELPFAVTGSQGIAFDTSGNLYVAQGINDWARMLWNACQGVTGAPGCDDAEPNQEFQSAILKINGNGDVSVYASGLRSPYDVAVGSEDRRGRATFQFAGDNGEGDACEACEPEYPESPSRMRYDELNLVMQGKHYGWPNGPAEEPFGEERDHIGPLWNFARTEDRIPNDGFDNEWPVPTGIAAGNGPWGDLNNPVFLSLFNCPSMFAPDLGTVEVFTGPNWSSRTVLAKYVDGPIDILLDQGGNRLYLAEYATGNIYAISPAR